MQLLKKIESGFIDKGKVHIFSLGQSGYVLKTSHSVIYIDPYLSDYVEHPKGLNDPLMKRQFPPPINPKEITKIDAVLCTHGHIDHMDPWTIERIDPTFQFITTENAFQSNPVQSPTEFIQFIDFNKAIQINDINVTAIPAAHYKTTGIDGKPDCVSFIIKVAGKILFFWGDGVIYPGLIDTLKTYTFNAFFAPINGRDWFRDQKGIVGNINGRELSELCLDIDSNLLVPNHYDLFDYNSESIQHFQNYLNKFAPEQSYKILSPGEGLIL